MLKKFFLIIGMSFFIFNHLNSMYLTANRLFDIVLIVCIINGSIVMGQDLYDGNYNGFLKQFIPALGYMIGIKRNVFEPIELDV